MMANLRTPSECWANLFKIASLLVRRLVPSVLRSGILPELWGPYTVLSASKKCFVSFLSAKNWISSAFFAQPGVLHVSQPSLDCFTYVWMGSLTRYWAVITEECLVFWMFLFKKSLDFFFAILIKPVLVFARNWSLGVHYWRVNCVSEDCPVLIWILWTVFECIYHWWMLASGCLVSAWRHPISGTFLPFGCLAGWMGRLSLLTTSLWSVQQSAPRIVSVILFVLPLH